MNTCPNICPYCGAHLDAGETCDCEELNAKEPIEDRRTQEDHMPG